MTFPQSGMSTNRNWSTVLQKWYVRTISTFLIIGTEILNDAVWYTLQVLYVSEVVNRPEYIPRNPTFENLPNVFDVRFSQVQPYLHRVCIAIILLFSFQSFFICLLPPKSTRSHFSLLNARILFLHSLLLLLCTLYSGDIRARRRGSRWDRKKIHQRHFRILAIIKSHTSSPSFLSFIYCTLTIILP